MKKKMIGAMIVSSLTISAFAATTTTTTTEQKMEKGPAATVTPTPADAIESTTAPAADSLPAAPLNKQQMQDPAVENEDGEFIPKINDVDDGEDYE